MSLFPEPAPSLPPFSTLLITGPYHPSAPIHLAFSSSGPKSPTLFLCPSRSIFKEDMLRFNDAWLNTHSGTGKNSELASHVSIFYPPTPVHLSLLLSMFHVPRSGSSHAGSTSKTAQVVAPSLIILAEPSSYFLSPNIAEMSSTPPTLSSYLNLVNRVFVSISNFTSGDHLPKFALFDSHLENLKLPLISAPSSFTDEQASDEQPELTPVFPLVENLFQWVGVFQDDDSYVPSSQGDEMVSEEEVHKQLRMYRQDQNGGDNERSYRWVERRCKSRSSKLEETEFSWDPS